MTDKSGKNNDGTVFGATWTGKGKIGGAYQFQNKGKVNPYILLPDTLDDFMDGKHDFTVSYWCYRHSIPAPQQFPEDVQQIDIVFRHSSTVLLAYEAGKQVFSVHAAGLIPHVLHAKSQMKEWEHWTGVFVSGGDIVLYRNGVLAAKASPQITKIHSFGESNRIGWKTWNLWINQYPPDHIIDEVCVFDRALSSLEVVGLFTSSGRSALSMEDEQEIITLVRQLGGDDSRLRKDALRKLAAMGSKALPVLIRYENDDDPEIRISVRKLLEP